MEAIEIFEIIGSFCAVLSLIFVSYIWIFRLGRLIERVDMMWKTHEKLEGMITKFDILWEDYRINSIFAVADKHFTQRQSLYRITEEGKKKLDVNVKSAIEQFADKEKNKLRNKSEREIIDAFIVSNEYKEIKDIALKSSDITLVFGLIFAYTIEKIKMD